MIPKRDRLLLERYAEHDGTGPDPDEVDDVVLTIRIHQEGRHYVGLCQELDVSSFGDTVEATLGATLEATALYLETFDDDDELLFCVPHSTQSDEPRMEAAAFDDATRKLLR